jgi:hypothetical protein
MLINTTITLLIIRLPILILKFWLLEGPTFLVKAMTTLIGTTANILSITTLIETFFAPWKGEYRKGYVAIARSIGVTIRLFTIILGLVIIIIEALLCFGIIVLWITAPFYWTALFILTLGGIA